MESLETRIPPPIWALLFAAVAFGIGQLDLGWEMSGGGTAGLLIGGFGLVLAAIAVIDVVGSGSSVDPHDFSKTHSLQTTGVYRLTRNPMYLGLAAVVCGVGVAVGDPIGAIVGTIGFVLVVTRLQIIPEERAMLKRFPKKYPAYQKQTRRWI